MDTAKVQQNSLEETGANDPPKGTPRQSSIRLGGLQLQLIIPFAVLTLMMALVGVFIITGLAVDSERERFQNSLLDANRIANDQVIAQEKNQLDRLRYLVFADGMAQAVYDQDSEKIDALMQPIVTNASIDIIATIDQYGQEALTLVCEPGDQICHTQQGIDFSGIESVRKVLQGVTDDQGDKFVELLYPANQAAIFTVAPVKDTNGQIVGAIMVGNYVSNLLAAIKTQALADALLVAPDGKLITTTMTGEGLEEMAALTTQLNPNDKTRPMEVKFNARDYQIAYSPLSIRGETIGWLGVFKNSDYLVSQVAQSRNLFILVFSIGTLMIIFVGLSLANRISIPILRLRDMSQAVAAGNFDQQIGLHQKDEIGELGNAFDAMTRDLKEQNEQIHQLYDEALQRNKELAEINAKLKATQLQLIQSEKLAAIGQLTAGIVHDVKNPFAVIMGMAEVLGEGNQLDEETQHGLKIIRESAVKGNRIVSDLLKFSRQTKPEMKTGDLRETVETALRLTAYLTRRFSLTKTLPETALIVTYDAQQIEQVLINMIHNAVQAMPNGGKLRIELSQQDNMAQVIIQDSGTGISSENLKRVFDPFFTTKPEGEGTGLGLSVSYGIVANHNGQITVDSEEGQGTQFTILLPISQSQNESTEDNQS